MKKILFILATFLCSLLVEAQNVGDEFDVPFKGKFCITSTNPAEVALVKVGSDVPSPGIEFNTVTYENKEYSITSLKTNSFRNYNNNNSIFKFDKLTHFESDAFSNTTCAKIDMSAFSGMGELPQSAFYNCHCGTILIPSTITTIPEKAFQWSDVNSINNSNLTRIEGAAFYGCAKLTTINLNNVTHIGDVAFYDCSNLQNISMAEVEYIGRGAFEGCNKLQNIALPLSLKTVKASAFEDCFLSSLSLHNNVTTFENSGDIMADDGTITMNIVDWGNKNVLADFAGYNKPITYKHNDEIISGNYNLPNIITKLGEGGLYNCTDLTAINMPMSLTQIGAKALTKCTNLTSIVCLATTAPAVDNANAFDEIDKSISISIPDNGESYYSYIHTIGWKDFTNYSVSLQTVKDAAIIALNHTAGPHPSQAVKNIIADYSEQINSAEDKATIKTLSQEGVEAIIAQIYIDRGVVKINNIYYTLNKDRHTAAVTYGGIEADGYVTAEYKGSITIPATVEYENATYNVTLIDKHAFQNCIELTAITLPDDITEISEYAFYGCSKIKDLVLPYRTRSINSYAFSSCTALRTLELPYMIQAIDNLAFEKDYALTTITSLSPTPCALGYNPFNGVDKSIPIIVQGASLTLYQKDPWGGFTNFINNASLDEAKTQAKNDINKALGSYSIVGYIGNLALHFCQHVEAATNVDDVEALRVEGVYGVTYSIKSCQAMLGDMAIPCTDCTAVEVKKGDKTVTLYAPDSVKYIIKK